jgi:predicted esterase YcpF (UPF0227 family)
MTSILYLHGFLSSPESNKVRVFRAASPEGVRVFAPDLNVPPLEADRIISALVGQAEADSLTVVGSSLGGFWAARAAVRHGLRCVLLNPCFNPWVFVGRHMGVQTIYGTDRRIEVKASAADELMALAEEVSPLAVDPGRTLVVLGTADETLDWRAGLCRLQAGDYSRRGSPHLEHRGGHAPYHGLHSQ